MISRLIKSSIVLYVVSLASLEVVGVCLGCARAARGRAAVISLASENMCACTFKEGQFLWDQ